MDIITTVKEAIEITINICRLTKEHNENKTLIKTISEHLCRLEQTLHENHVILFNDTQPSPRPNTVVVREVSQELLPLKHKLSKLDESLRQQPLRSWLRADQFGTDLREIRDVCSQCKDRLERISLFTALESRFHLRLDRFLAVIRDSPHTIPTVTPSTDSVHTPSSNAPSPELFQSLSEVHQAFASIIPHGPSQLPSNMATLSTSSPISSSFTEFSDTMEEKEQGSILAFAKLPSAVNALILQASRSGASSSHTPHFQALIKAITELWNGWRISASALQYENNSMGGNVILGRGASGIVCSGKLTHNFSLNSPLSRDIQLPVAIKEIDTSVIKRSSPEFAAQLLRELFLQLSIRHECIVRTFGASWPQSLLPYLAAGTSDASLERKTLSATSTIPKDFEKVRIVSEQMSCNLSDALKQGYVSTPHEMYRVLRDVSRGLTYLHSLRIIHRDLKPQNILVRVDESHNGNLVGFAKLCDFGCSRHVLDERNMKTFTSVTAVAGTTPYLPPEVLADAKSCRTRASWDVWAFGLLICEVFSRESSEGFDPFGVKELAESGELVVKMREWARRVDDALFQEIALKCLQQDPVLRPTMTEIKEMISGCEGPDNSLKVVPRIAKQYIACPSIPVTEQAERERRRGIQLEVFENRYMPMRMARAQKHYRNAMGEGDVVSMLLLASCHQFGKGCTKNKKKAAELCWQAFEKEDGTSVSLLSMLANRVPESEVHRRKFKEMREKHRSSKRSLETIRRMGLLFFYGIGTAVDYTKAVALFREGCELGDVTCTVWLGQCYEGGFGVEKDDTKALEIYTEGADAGHAPSIACRASCFGFGVGTKKDGMKSIELCRQAVHLGDTGAISVLGVCLNEGECVEQDKGKGNDYFVKGIFKGSGRALMELGVSYLYGHAVTMNDRRARRLLRCAFEWGSVSATKWLGM